MKSELVALLKTICPIVRMQGSFLPEEQYPDKFITLWIPDTRGNAYYNDKAHTIDWIFDVIYYSTSEADLDQKAEEIWQILTDNGYIIQGKGHLIPCDEPTHLGWVFDVRKTETINR